MDGLYASVVVPAAEESITLPLGNTFHVDLANQLVQQIQLHSVSGYELAWVDGQVGPPGNGDVPDGQVDASLSGPQLPTLGPKTDQSGSQAVAGSEASTSAGEVPSYGGVFIGDVRLSELRKALTAAGIRSEFRGGDLYCSGQVVVRRRGEGGLILEGAMGDGYYRVRDIIYGQYHVC
jgi:cleavage and polyadenylation specificity factor subunit 2